MTSDIEKEAEEYASKIDLVGIAEAYLAGSRFDMRNLPDTAFVSIALTIVKRAYIFATKRERERSLSALDALPAATMGGRKVVGAVDLFEVKKIVRGEI